MLQIIYPERRSVSETEVIQWALDRMIDERYAEIATPATDGEQILDDPKFWQAERETKRPTLQEAIAYLEDVGVVTFAGRGRRS